MVANIPNKKIKFVRFALWDCQKTAAPYLDRYIAKERYE